jgi:hypothetical protein
VDEVDGQPDATPRGDLVGVVDDGEGLDHPGERPGRHHLGEAAADELVAVPAEEPLDRRAEPADRAGVVDERQREDRVVDHRLEGLERRPHGLDQLDAVAEGVVGVDPADVGHLVGRPDLVARLHE